MDELFAVRPRGDLSLADLVQLHSADAPVLRSAHAGNWAPANLNIAALGLPCVLTDLTTPRADTIYHPAGVIVGRRLYNGLCQLSHSLVARTAVRPTHLPPGFDEWFPAGKNLADAHLDVLRKVIPQANVTMFSDFARRDLGTALTLVELAADAMPSLWRRTFHPTVGVKVTDVGPGGWRDVAAKGVFGLTGDHGWLVPNAVMILMMAVLDARRHDAAEVYHLGGVRMMHYIGGLAATLDRLYGRVAAVLRMPHRFVFNIVPTAEMTLGAPADDRHALDELVDVHLSTRSRRGPGADSTAAEQSAVRTELFRHRSRLAWAAASCPYPFYDVRDADYCTQYDLLLRGCDWHINPWGLHTPLRLVGRMVAAVDAARAPQGRRRGAPDGRRTENP